MLNPIPTVNTRVEYLFRFFQSMPEKELREELRKASLNQSGSRKQMIKRLRDHHRKELIEHRKKINRNFHTENLYDYLIAIDFECTCEAGIYEYDNEIIEFPAVLVSVQDRKIIDSFHAVIRPKNNPKLTKYCTKLTGITQEMVDEASSFPEALDMFREWMYKHGLDGLHKAGGGCRRFCYITDGPWDIAKFLQSDCLRWGMPIPHDFRYFLNLRRAFVNFYCHARPGKPKPARLPSADLSEMLKRLGMSFVGHEHNGMDDTINIARIVIQMLSDHAELRVNEKLVNVARLLPWQQNQLVFTDEMWERQQNKNAPTSSEAVEQSSPPHAVIGAGQQTFFSSTSPSAEQIICAGMAKMGFREDDNDNEAAGKNGASTTNGNNKMAVSQKSDDESRYLPLPQKNATVLYKWWDVLPYKLVRISREQFISELFLECESCDEVTEQEECQDDRRRTLTHETG